MKIISHSAYVPRRGDMGYTANQKAGSTENFLGVILLRRDEYIVADYTAGPGRFDRFWGHYTSDYSRAVLIYNEKNRKYMDYVSVARVPEGVR